MRVALVILLLLGFLPCALAGEESAWADTAAEEEWFEFSVLVILILCGAAFEFLDENIEHHLASEVEHHETHFDFSNDFWSILIRSFHSEVSIVGFLAFIVWILRRSEALESIVADSLEGVKGPMDRVTLEHHIENLHMYLFISMSVHIMFCSIFTYQCDSIYTRIARYGRSDKATRATDPDFARLYKMDTFVQDYFSVCFPAETVDFPPYCLSKIRATITRLTMYTTKTWLMLAVYFALFCTIFFAVETDQAWAITETIYLIFCIAMVSYLGYQAYSFDNRIQSAWDGAESSNLDDATMIGFLQFSFFYINYTFVLNVFEVHENSMFVYFGWLMVLLCVPKLLSNHFIFVMSMPPYFDHDDMQHMRRTSAYVAEYGYGGTSLKKGNTAGNQIAPSKGH